MPERVADTTVIPAATILLVRDTSSGLEVFMVKRHHQIDFATGALVFPGGKTAAGDGDPGLAAWTDAVDTFPSRLRAPVATAIREAFEETGILLARDIATGELVTGERLDALAPYRARLEKGEIGLCDFAGGENLRLAFDRLVHFAHWITPRHMPKRFDTHFFIARAPEGQIGSHDGRESVDSVWISPKDAISDSTRWKVIFPTRLNLMKLAQSKTTGEALSTAMATPPLTVEPWVEEGTDGPILRIRDDAGYRQTWAPVSEAV
jgi:8-oxo-dGTP pyrophosphatase MutT (NUDIX family)